MSIDTIEAGIEIALYFKVEFVAGAMEGTEEGNQGLLVKEIYVETIVVHLFVLFKWLHECMMRGHVGEGKSD